MKKYLIGLSMTAALAVPFLPEEFNTQDAGAFNASTPEIAYIQLDKDKYEPRKTRHQPILVLHETTTSADWVYRNVNESTYQASFHAFIDRSGKISLLVPPDQTAYTAGRSEFNEDFVVGDRSIPVTPGAPGNETDPSGYGGMTVNHFAYQIELESPPDGYWCAEPSPKPGECVDGGGRGETHSGYTNAQYHATAWLAVKTGIPKNRITTHAQVDTSGTRSDPRSFNWDTFWKHYASIGDRKPTISLGIEKRKLAENLGNAR